MKDQRQEENCTKKTWVYDLRTNMESFGKRNPFGDKQLKDFEKVYGRKADGTSKRTDQGEEGQFRCFDRAWVKERGDSLDISWLKDDSVTDAADLPAPDVLAAEAMGELTEALRELNELMISLGSEDEAKQQRDLLGEVLGLGEV